MTNVVSESIVTEVVNVGAALIATLASIAYIVTLF